MFLFWLKNAAKLGVQMYIACVHRLYASYVQIVTVCYIVCTHRMSAPGPQNDPKMTPLGAEP